MKQYIDENILGLFNLGDDTLVGELKLCGLDSTLKLWSQASWKTRELPRTIQGKLNDLKIVTLLGCIEHSSKSYFNTDQEESSSLCEVLFEYAVFGDKTIGCDENIVDSIEFYLDGSTELFDDSSSFHDLFCITPNEVKKLLQEQQCRVRNLLETNFSETKFPEVEFNVGDKPIASIFTNPDLILNFDIPYGVLKVKNSSTRTLASSSGYQIKNRISFSLEFDSLITIDQAVKRIDPIVLLFSILADHDFEISNMRGYRKEIMPYDDGFKIYRCWGRPNRSDEGPKRHHRLIRPEVDVEEFKDILCKWLCDFEDWSYPRWQFFGAFVDASYGTDKLIKCANTFDIIPDKAFGRKPELDVDVKQAKEQARALFKSLPNSPERQSILGALGRLGTHTLKYKVRSRANIIKVHSPEVLSEIFLVVDSAVDCRNYYVHGGRRKFDYESNFEIVMFFIDTLEFVYAVSELIELGWNYKNWIDKKTYGHRFSRYVSSYPHQLRMLKALLK